MRIGIRFVEDGAIWSIGGHEFYTPDHALPYCESSENDQPELDSRE